MTHQCSHERAPASAHASAHASVHEHKFKYILYGWYYSGVTLQIWVNLICVLSPYSNRACKFGWVLELAGTSGSEQVLFGHNGRLHHFGPLLFLIPSLAVPRSLLPCVQCGWGTSRGTGACGCKRLAILGMCSVCFTKLSSSRLGGFLAAPRWWFNVLLGRRAAPHSTTK